MSWDWQTMWPRPLFYEDWHTLATPIFPGAERNRGHTPIYSWDRSHAPFLWMTDTEATPPFWGKTDMEATANLSFFNPLPFPCLCTSLSVLFLFLFTSLIMFCFVSMWFLCRLYCDVYWKTQTLRPHPLFYSDLLRSLSRWLFSAFHLKLQVPRWKFNWNAPEVKFPTRKVDLKIQDGCSVWSLTVWKL